MKITRWSAEIPASIELAQQLFVNEGLEPRTHIFNSGSKLSHQRTMMTEILQVITGELVFNLSGNQFVIRPGDKLEIPPNTVYSYSNLKDSKCVFISVQKL